MRTAVIHDARPIALRFDGWNREKKKRPKPSTRADFPSRGQASNNSLVLPHLDLITVLFKLHFVHELADEINAAPVIGVEIFVLLGIGQLIQIESGSGVGNGDHDAAARISVHPAADFFGWIISASVDDGVRQSLLNRQRNLKALLFRNLQTG